MGPPPHMKIRLFHLTFLLIAATVLVGELAMGGVMALNLRRGFADYLVARDRDRMTELVGEITDKAGQRGGLAALRDGRITLAGLLHEMAPPPPHPRPMPPPPRRDGHRPPHLPPDPFEARLILNDASGRQIEGPPPPPRADAVTGPIETRDLLVEGVRVGSLTLVPRGPAPAGVDQRFLTSQYYGGALLAALLLALSLIPAWLLARAGAQVARRMTNATGAIATGDFTARAPEPLVREAAEVGHDINRMAETLARLDTARRRWLAEVSHELRTPLAAMRGELEALADGVRPLTLEAIASVNDEALSLSRLVEDLHFIALSELATPPTRYAPADVVELCRQSIARFADRAERQGIRLGLDRNGHEAMPVLWDGQRIEQLLGNALTNCLRYTDAPGRALITLRHSGGADGGTVGMTIDDTAPGVPDDQLDQLFEPLYRLDTARDRASGGSGLGLAVSEAIVRAHGGTISAEASPLGGLRLVITLPATARAS